MEFLCCWLAGLRNDGVVSDLGGWLPSCFDLLLWMMFFIGVWRYYLLILKSGLLEDISHHQSKVLCLIAAHGLVDQVCVLPLDVSARL